MALASGARFQTGEASECQSFSRFGRSGTIFRLIVAAESFCRIAADVSNSTQVTLFRLSFSGIVPINTVGGGPPSRKEFFGRRNRGHETSSVATSVAPSCRVHFIVLETEVTEI